jgi:hypothetical protein
LVFNLSFLRFWGDISLDSSSSWRGLLFNHLFLYRLRRLVLSSACLGFALNLHFFFRFYLRFRRNFSLLNFGFYLGFRRYFSLLNFLFRSSFRAFIIMNKTIRNPNNFNKSFSFILLSPLFKFIYLFLPLLFFFLLFNFSLILLHHSLILRTLPHHLDILFLCRPKFLSRFRFRRILLETSFLFFLLFDWHLLILTKDLFLNIKNSVVCFLDDASDCFIVWLLIISYELWSYGRLLLFNLLLYFIFHSWYFNI